jgi:outer membrane lipase/esterase
MRPRQGRSIDLGGDTMIRKRSVVWALLGSALLAACGGGDVTVPGTGAPAGAPTTKGNFTALVTFGDSLSDQGSYAPATSLSGDGQAPYFGGKFTVNLDANAGTIWVENLATTLGLTVFPAEMGFAGSSVKCPVKYIQPSAATLCTSYGQGGARVTDPNGIGHTTASGAAAALTVPIVSQIDNHLAAFGGKFNATDLVFVWGGNNDVFAQFAGFGAAAAQIQAKAAAGTITADEAKKQLYDAQTAAQEGMKHAAQELSTYVRDKILAKGGKYVAVVNLPDSATTPFGSSLSADARGVLSTLVDTFNLWLRDGMIDQPVLWLDQNAASKDLSANPAKYGFVERSIPVCDADKIKLITGGAVTDGSSLFCNGTAGMPYNGIRTGADPMTWAFADGVHPSLGGHKAISNFMVQQLMAAGWI